MSEDLIIRLAAPDDLPALEQLGDDLFDNAIKPDRAREFFDDLRHHLVVAEWAGQIVGMASGFQYIHPDKDPALFVNEVSVLEQYRNKGMARAMVKYLCDYGKQQGCTEAWVATEKSNVAARKAYIAAGGIEDKEPIVLINFEY